MIGYPFVRCCVIDRVNRIWRVSKGAGRTFPFPAPPWNRPSLLPPPLFPAKSCKITERLVDSFDSARPAYAGYCSTFFAAARKSRSTSFTRGRLFQRLTFARINAPPEDRGGMNTRRGIETREAWYVRAKNSIVIPSRELCVFFFFR